VRKDWAGLGSVVPSLREFLGAAPPGAPVPEQGAHVAAAYLGPAATTHDLASLTNLGVLAVLSRAAPETWLVRPGAARVVERTDLRSIPSEPPRLLRSPGVVDAHRPETGDRLWGDYASLGWYQLGGATYLVGLAVPDGYAVARWEPRWTGQDLESELPAPDVESPMIRDLVEHGEFASSAARFLVVMGILLEAQGSPLQVELERGTRRRHVRLDPSRARARPGSRPAPRYPPAGPGAAASRVPDERPVEGHVRRQRHGPGLALMKWIYVEQYEATRWLSPRWLVSPREA
jgi:hypothetical protein